ncbi:MAG: DMT family protein [Gemmataceae bacterium]
MRTVLLLVASNTFMNIAWYGHLRYRGAPLIIAILVSWLIALPEYMLAVPANRFGRADFSLPQLKMIQEVVSVSVFLALTMWFGEAPTKREVFALLLIGCGVAIAVSGREVAG